MLLSEIKWLRFSSSWAREYLWTAWRETEVERKERTCKEKTFAALKLLLMETFSISDTIPSFITKLPLFCFFYSLGLMHCNIHFSSVINSGTIYTWCKYRMIPLTSGGSWVDASVNESRMVFNTSSSGSTLALYKENQEVLQVWNFAYNFSDESDLSTFTFGISGSWVHIKSLNTSECCFRWKIQNMRRMCTRFSRYWRQETGNANDDPPDVA